MVKQEVARGPGGRVLIMGSITQVEAQDAGTWVVSASHGGVSSGEFALEVPLQGAFFNDAGVGKDEAGIAALAMLQACGVVSHANARALAWGILPGKSLRDCLLRLLHG